MIFGNTFYEIAVILGLAAVIGALGQKLRQPLIIMFLVTGIVAGPACLGVIESHQQIELLAQIGIALLLFMTLVILMATDLVPIVIAATLVAALMVAAGCISSGDARRSEVVVAAEVDVAGPEQDRADGEHEDDQAQARHRSEDGRARPDDDVHLAGAHAPPLVIALPFRELAVHGSDAAGEAGGDGLRVFS